MAPDSSAQSSASLAPVRVWDPYVRLFHWLLVSGIVAAWITGNEGRMDLHYKIGLGVLGLVIFRILWGLVGSRTARFTHFVKGPGAVLRYMKSMLKRKPSFAFGHNAGGGAMVVVLLLVVLVQASSGLFNSDDILFEGPFYAKVPDSVSRLMGFLHGSLFNLLLLLVGLHLAVIALYLVWKRENLVRAMVTGRALLPKENGEADFASPLRALVVAVIAAIPPIAIYVLN